MTIFVVGASGVLGRAFLPHLVARGERVVGVTRSPDKRALLEALGAEPVVCDVYDAGALRAAAIAAAPRVVVNFLTDLAGGGGPGYARNTRIRREGGPIVVDAARAAGAQRLIVESIVFATSPESDAAVAALEDGARASGMDALILRFGLFWGPGTWRPDAPGPPPAVHVETAGRRAADLLDAAPGTYTITDGGRSS
jgi:nucleoside-diphosphate-sugar epimerase